MKKINLGKKFNIKFTVFSVILFAVIMIGICFFAKYLPMNSFGANNEKVSLKANMEKYINFKTSNQNTGTLLQYNIKMGVESEQNNEQASILKQSQIKLELSKIDEKYPYEIKLIPISTEATNGKVKDIKEQYRYNPETGMLIINTSNLNENNELIKSEVTNNNKDEYTVLCYYDTYSEEEKEREIDVKITGVVVLAEDDRLINSQEELKRIVTKNIGELTSLQYVNSEIYNGNIKSNIINETNYNTQYSEIQKIEISQKEVQEKIELKEENTFVKSEKNDNNEEIDVDLGNDNKLIYKSTTIKKEQFLKILGEDGKIEISDLDDNLLILINKDSAFDENDVLTVNYQNDVKSIKIKTSKIQTEGILEIENTKEIKSTMRNPIDVKIKTTAILSGLEDEIKNNELLEKPVFSNNYINILKINDSKSNVELKLNKTDWTNKEQNEVIFDININSNTISDNMLKNPSIKIELPDEVEKVLLKNSLAMYTNGLELQEPYLEVNEEGKKYIIANLIGEQKEYDENQFGLVTNIRIPATIILNKDIDKSVKEVKFTYLNNYTLDGQTEIINKNLEINLESYKKEDVVESNNYINTLNNRLTSLARTSENAENIQQLRLEVEPKKGDITLNDGDIVYEGEFIKYNVKITNITNTELQNIKIIGNIPEGTVSAELDADYNNYMGKYEYVSNENATEKQIIIDSLKPNETYNTFYEVKVKDLQEIQNELEISTNINTFINEEQINSYNLNNIVKKADVKIFLGAFLDNSEDRWNYSLKVESNEDKQVNVRLVFPEAYKVELRVQAGGQDGTYQPVLFQDNVGNILEDTVETNKEYWYQGKIDSSLINEPIDNLPIVLTAVATAKIDGKEYKSNENRINYETRNVSVTMTSKTEGEEIDYGQEVDYEITVKNIGKTNLIQEERDVFSVNVQDYIPEELKLTSVEYENWEETENGWEKKKYNQNVKLTYYDENGNKLPEINQTVTIPYGEEIKIKITATPQIISEKTTIKNSVTVNGTYINTKVSNTISHTILPYFEDEGNIPDSDDEENKDKESSDQNERGEKYSISGLAWIDENTDGQRQDRESLINDLEVMLANINDSKNVVAKTRTDSDGKYKFNNLDLGKYIVLFRYNTNSYSITEYQKEGIAPNRNSDANKEIIKLNGNELEVGATDIIELNQNKENVNIGLIKKGICDVKLDKYISKVTVTTNKTTKDYNYEKQKLAKVEIKSKEIEGATVEIQYKIVVTNEGEIPVNIGKITDYIPEGLEFASEKNNNWGKQTGNKLINTSLANKNLNVGESTELTLILTKKMTGNATGEYKNSAEITEMSNVLNINDKDSNPDNNKVGEDDFSEASVIISIGTGGIIYISITVIAIVALIIVLTILSKKGILKNKNITRIAKLSIFVVIFTGILLARDNNTWSAEGNTVTRLAPQSLNFFWDKNSDHRNFYGSICFWSEKSTKTNNQYWEAHCQNAGLNAANGNYKFQNATGLIEESETVSNKIPKITIKKQDYDNELKNYDVVNIEKRFRYGDEYWLYGPISFNCSVKNKPENNDINIIYYIEILTCNKTVKINSKKYNENYLITDILGGGYQFGRNGGKESFYLMIKKTELQNPENPKKEGIHKIIVTAKVDGEEKRVTKTKGFLHYYYDDESQSIKTTERHDYMKDSSSTTIFSEDSEEWDTFNIELNINKEDYDDSTTKLNDVGFRIEKGNSNNCLNYIENESILSEPRGYKGEDWSEITKEDIDNKTEKYLNTIHTTDYVPDLINYSTYYIPGKIRIRNLKAIGIPYYTIIEENNNNYGYNIGVEDRKIDLYNPTVGGIKSNYGRIIDIDFKNIKNTGNLSIHKKDEDTGEALKKIKFKIRKKKNINKDKQYLIALDENNTIQKSVTGEILLGNLDYTNNKEEATEFITNTKGYIRIYNLLCSDYIIEELESPEHIEYDVNDENSISWKTICTDTDNQTTTNSGKGKEIEVTIKRQYSTQTNKNNKKIISNKVNITNKKKHIKISGYVFEDIGYGEQSITNNLYKDGENDSNDVLLDGITVRLKDKTTNNIVKETTTSNGGAYQFVDVLLGELENYYIEFEYDGLTYQNVPSILDKDNGSKSVENGNMRDEFNNGFAFIEGETETTGVAKDVNGNVKHQLSYTRSDNKAILNKGNYPITATTDEAGYNIKEHYTGQEEIKNINLGLRKREMPDLAISTDIADFEVNVNGYSHTYVGNNRFENRKTYTEDENENAIFNAEVKMSEKYRADSYTRELYESDYKNSSFEAYVTYEIKIRNESTNLKSRVNSLVNYFDKTYLDVQSVYYPEDNNGQGNIIQNEGIVTNISEFNEKYNKIDISNLNLEIDYQKERSVFVLFKLKNNISLNDKTIILDNYSEITSYSTTKDNKIYGGVDKDSNPGNFKLNETDIDKQFNEDDNDKAPSLKIEIAQRLLSGTVFLDKEIEGKKGGTGQERQGNGIFDNDESKIKGVKVGLYKLSDFDNNGKLKDNVKSEGKTYYSSKISDADEKIEVDGKTYYYNVDGSTEEDGEFILTDFIPGEYKLVYTWGNEEYSVENYKGTIWTKDNINEKFIDGNFKGQENKEWYRNQTLDNYGNVIRFTDAKDNWAIREEGTTDKMQSATNDLCFGIELNDNINSKSTTTKMIQNELKFIVLNTDFGIIEKAKQSLLINKKVENIDIVLTNGQTIVDATFDENGKIIGTAKGVQYLPSEIGKMPIMISIDSELIQGAKANITYKIKVQNNSELDYDSKEYYYYGIAEGANTIKVQPKGVYDYLDSTMVFNQESNNIEDNGTWEIKSLDEYNTYKEDKIEPTLIEQYLYEKYSKEQTEEGSIAEITGYEEFKTMYSSAIENWSTETIKEARQKRLANKTILHNEKLERPLAYGEENANTAILKASILLSNQDEINLNNDSEIVNIKYESDNGGRIQPLITQLYDRAANVVITTPTGKKDYTIEIIQIVVFGLIIVTTVLIFVKKKIIK